MFIYIYIYILIWKIFYRIVASEDLVVLICKRFKSNWQIRKQSNKKVCIWKSRIYIMLVSHLLVNYEVFIEKYFCKNLYSYFAQIPSKTFILSYFAWWFKYRTMACVEIQEHKVFFQQNAIPFIFLSKILPDPHWSYENLATLKPRENWIWLV